MRWKYGNYEFKINPSSQSERIRLEGDNVRTLTGALISQPTSLMEAYDVSSVFYQPRSRVTSVTSIPNAILIAHNSYRLYALNRTNNRVDVYNANSVLLNSISLASIPSADRTYIAFDAQSDFIWIYSSTHKIFKLSHSGTLAQTSPVLDKTKDVKGMRITAGYAWVLKYNGEIDKLRLADFALTTKVILPSGLYYSGISSIEDYLIVGNNDSGKRAIYHVDSINGFIVNSISMDDIPEIGDVSFDGSSFYIVNSQRLYSITGNTVEYDIYRLEREIDGKQFANMVDDMGISRRVQISEFSKSRRQGYENMYNISMSITKINRG